MRFSKKTRTEGSLIFEILKNPEPVVISIIKYLPNTGSDPGEPSSLTAAVREIPISIQISFHSTTHLCNLLESQVCRAF
jgi:hypothetical protein